MLDVVGRDHQQILVGPGLDPMTQACQHAHVVLDAHVPEADIEHHGADLGGAVALQLR